MIEDLKRQFDLLMVEMQSCQYKLTTAEEKGFFVIPKGYFGYLLTKGFWYKLRIWICIEENNQIKCKLDLCEDFYYKENALKVLNQRIKNQTPCEMS